MVHQYLAVHPFAGRALFTDPADARDWADRQTQDYADEYLRLSWVDSGQGWVAQRLPSGGDFEGAATVYALLLDEYAPKGFADED